MIHNQPQSHLDARRLPKVRPTEIYCDFGGTITSLDATDAVLETFALPAWRKSVRRASTFEQL